MPSFTRRLFATLPLLCAATLAPAQGSPVPSLIRVVVPYSPGATTDVLARAVFSQLGTRLGTTVIVENRAGGSGMIGTAAVVKGPRDGSVLLFQTSSLVTSTASLKNPPIDVMADLAPVAIVADTTLLVGVSSKTGIRSPQEFVAAARASGSGLTAGSPGVGTVTHLATELLAEAAKAPIRHIPYKGASLALIDVAAGTIDVLLGTYSSLAPQIKTGRVVPVAITADKPNPSFPQLPLMNSVAPGLNVGAWFMLLAPTGTPRELIERLNREVNALSNTPEVRKLLEAEGALPGNLSTEAVTQRFRDDYRMWKRITVEKNIAVD